MLAGKSLFADSGLFFPMECLHLRLCRRDPARLASNAVGAAGALAARLLGVSEVINLQNVSVVRGGKSIIDSLTFSVGPTERWVVLGANGAGKTTLLKA